MGQILSYSLSVGFLFFYAYYALAIVIVARKQSRVLDVTETYPKLQACFDLLRKSNKESLYFSALFLFRRAMLAVILVFVNNSLFQIYALIFVSLGQIMYLLHVRPLEEPKFN